jgi:hypothetical protein
MRFAPLILILSLLTGCVLPIPHRSVRNLAFTGKVLDERTHAPIQGAKIFLTDHPQVSCESDVDGGFQFKESYNWHLLYLIGAGNSADWPEQKFWWPKLTVSHTNYVTHMIDSMQVNQGDILLKRSGEPPESHPWLIFNRKGEILQDMGAAQYLKPGGIHINEHIQNSKDQEKDILAFEFVKPVHDPQIKQLRSSDTPPMKGREKLGTKGESIWEFQIFYRKADSSETPSRTYSLEFTP